MRERGGSDASLMRMGSGRVMQFMSRAAERITSDGPETEATSVPGEQMRAPSVHYLCKEFVREVRATGYSRSSTIHDIEAAVLRGPRTLGQCPRDGKQGTAFVDSLLGADRAGPATLMLSYTWGYSLADITDALQAYCENSGLDPKRTYCWLCCICINQHRVKDATMRGEVVPFDEFADAFSSRVRSIGHILALLGTWQAPRYITRAWCIYELYMAMSLDCTLDIIIPEHEAKGFLVALTHAKGETDSLWQALGTVDVRKAEASIPTDKENILRLIAEGPGHGALNRMVQSKLQTWFAATAEKQARLLHEKRKWCPLTCKKGGRAMVRLAGVLVELNQTDRMLEITTEWYSRLTKTRCKNSGVAASILGLIGFAHMAKGNVVDAMTAMNEASRVRKVNGTMQTAEGAELLGLLGLGMAESGDISGGLAKMQEGWSILEAERSTESQEAIALLVRLGVLASLDGKSDRAEEYHKRAKGLMEAKGVTRTPRAAQQLAQMAYVCARGGAMERALGLATEAVDILVETGTLETLTGAQCLSIVGWVKAESGDLVAASDSAARAMKVHLALGTLSTPRGVEGLIAMSYVKERMGQTDHAKSLKRQASASMQRQASEGSSGPKATKGSAILHFAPAKYFNFGKTYCSEGSTHCDDCGDNSDSTDSDFDLEDIVEKDLAAGRLEVDMRAEL